MIWYRTAIVFIAIVSLTSLQAGAQQGEHIGLIEPYRIVNIGSQQIGVLATVEIDRGDKVKVGQVVATLQSEVERAAMEAAKYRSEMESGVKARETSKDLAERKRVRLDQLYGEKLIPFSDMDDAETAKMLAETQLRDAQENKRLADFEYKQAVAVVQRTTIRSPVNGVVMERFHHPGERIENEPILKIAQMDPLNVEMILPTALYLNIRVGMRAQVTIDPPIGGRYIASVKVVDKVMDAASGTFGVRLELPNPDNRLPAGIKCKVVFLGGQ
jgi:RND family efflux transporter MFP subunit